MRSRRGSIPAAQCSRKLAQPSAISRQLCSRSCASSGMNTLSSSWPDIPAMPTATSLPITCAAAIVSASTCVGLTLPGMIELPGSFSGIAISPIPERGPEASSRTSLAILKSDTATVRSAP